MSGENIKLCIDCEYYRRNSRTKKLLGTITDIIYESCLFYTSREAGSKCGPEAVYFTKKSGE